MLHPLSVLYFLFFFILFYTILYYFAKKILYATKHLKANTGVIIVEPAMVKKKTPEASPEPFR